MSDKSENLKSTIRPARLPVPRATPSSPFFPQLNRVELATVVCVCLVFLTSSFYRLNHTDLWGHLSFGRWIVQHQVLPDAELFAAGNAIEKFTNIPWLAQVGGYLAFQKFGSEGLILLHVLLVTASFGILMWAATQNSGNQAWGITAGIVGYLISWPIIGIIRPQLVGVTLFVLVLLACHQLRRSWLPVIWLAIIFALWANLHGSFLIALGLLGLIALGNSWESFCSSKVAMFSDPLVKRYWLAVLAALVAAACLNPIGPGLLFEISSFGSTEALSAITEWRPLVLFSVSGSLFFGSLLITAVILRFSSRRFTPAEVLLLIAFGILTLSAMRMLIWWALVWPWVMAPHVTRISDNWSKAYKPVENNSSKTMRSLIAIGFIFMSILISPSAHALITGCSRGIQATTSSETPIHVAEEIRRRKIQGRFFARMDWADYLIWHSHNQVRPMVYTHVHLLENRVFNDYRRLAQGDNDWFAIAADHQLDYLILSRAHHRRLWNKVQNHPQAHLVYEDKQCWLMRLEPTEQEKKHPHGE